VDDLVARLREENERLHDRIRDLVADLAPALDVPPEYGLTATEQRLFAHLSSRRQCTKRGLFAAAYGHMLDDQPDESTIESHLSKMRRKLAPFGLSIRGERFAGYRLERADG